MSYAPPRVDRCGLEKCAIFTASGNARNCRKPEAKQYFISAFPSDRLAARLAEWRRVLSGLSAMGLGDFVTVDLSVVRGG